MSSYILTKHARERLQQRWISEDVIASVLRSPQRTEPGTKPGSTKFIRTINGRQIQLIGSYLKEEDRWLIVSAWVRGEDDKAPLMWQLITLPFVGVWKLSVWIFKLIASSTKKSSHSLRH